MNRKQVWMVMGLLLAMATAGFAQRDSDDQQRFHGIINDYVAANVSPTGPWEVRGTWTLKLKGNSGKADFSAVLTMVRSDLWISGGGDPSKRTPHAHHLYMVDGVVTPIANGFRVTGPVMVTASGNPPPFGTNNTLQIDVTGGSVVMFSNVKLTFGGDAVGHFGTNAINGAVADSK